MKKIKNVQGSTKQAQPLIVNKDTVYEHTNIELINEEEGLYAYDEVQYTKDEYIQMIAEKNETLERDLTDTQLAIAEIYEILA